MSEDTEILDEIIEDLRTKRALADDFDERMKLTDRLMKAINMRQRQKGKKGRGFDLGSGNGQSSTRN